MHAHYSSLLLELLAEGGVSEQQLLDKSGLGPDQLFNASSVNAARFDILCLDCQQNYN